jgi:acetyltransferase-like isoleucine patch superfamily enzyme
MSPDPYPNRIEGVIEAEELTLGRGVVVERGVVITGLGGPARRVALGDFTYIGRETRVLAPEFRLGDYSKLHAFSFAHGDKPLAIGRNCWIGGSVVLDSIGGLDIDDNVGIGAHSQLWTHIKFGDVLEGCRFNSSQYMHVGRDAWFVGHCIVSPIRVGEKSMALAGSVVVKDMRPNHIYAGVPARDVTDKMGSQFQVRTPEEKAAILRTMIDAFEQQHPDLRGRLMVVGPGEQPPARGTWFDVTRRTYRKTYDPAEVAFLKEHVPLIKFIPEGEPPFVVPQQQLPPFPEEDGPRLQGTS